MLLLAQRSLGTAAVQYVAAASQPFSAPGGATGNFVHCFQKTPPKSMDIKSLEMLNAFGHHTRNFEFKADFLYVLQDYLGTSIWIRSSCSMQIKNLQVSAVLLVLQVLLVLCCVRIIWPFLSCQLNVTQCLQLLCESWVLDNICAKVSAIGTYREVKWAVLFSRFLCFCVYLADRRGVSLSWKTHSLRQAKGKKVCILQMIFLEV